MSLPGIFFFFPIVDKFFVCVDLRVEGALYDGAASFPIVSVDFIQHIERHLERFDRQILILFTTAGEHTQFAFKTFVVLPLERSQSIGHGYILHKILDFYKLS